MLTIVPDYYQNFKCIADKCKHNCCIGWEIDIDDLTLERYSKLESDFSSTLKSNIVFDDPPHFKLTAEERCPFLNKSGLCDIITRLGEDMLCQICSDHPRFRNYYDTFTEIGLGLCCESAAEIILTKADKTTFNIPETLKQTPIINFRQRLFDIIQDRNLPIDIRVENMLNTVDAKLDCNADWYQLFDSLETLDENWKKQLQLIKNGINNFERDTCLDNAYEQLIVYLLFRHFTDCQYDDMVKERILFSALIYKIIRAMNISDTIEELIEISRLYSCEIEYSDENTNKILLKLGQ